MTPFRASSLLALGLLTAGLASAVPTPRLDFRAPAGLFSLPAPTPGPIVPATVEFADLKLDLTEGGRASVQRLVDALYRHPTYLQQKIERADTYFPIIDRVFREEGVPQELRYLALQESGLVSDAVSSSNAVGFWQFKKEAAADFNIRVNASVDERRHIVESSRGAARYFRRSNAQLNNWVNSLLSYYTGLGGAKKIVSPADANARRMTISETTHPYVITFLAHKVAFEGRCGQNLTPAIRLEEVKARPGQTLDELAVSLSANPAEIIKYNKWLLAPTVPADKQYSVLVPVAGPASLAAAVATPAAELAFPAPATTENPQLPSPEVTQINGLKAVVARKGDTPDILALVVGMDVQRFRVLNELGDRENVVVGRPYYLQKKRNKAVAEYHVVQRGETIAQVSQQYGVKAKMIRKKNRMTESDPLQPGRLLWLQHTRPADVPVEFMAVTPATQIATMPLFSGALPPITPAAPPTSAGPEERVTTAFPPVNDLSTYPVPADEPAQAAASSTTASTTPATSEIAPEPAEPLGDGVKPYGDGVEARSESVESFPDLPAPVSANFPEKTEPTPSAPLPTAPVPATTSRPSSSSTHTIVKGETLSALSRQYSVSVKDLLTWNNLASPNLRLGQVVRVEGPATGVASVVPLPAPAPPTTDATGVTRHTVAVGESLYRLARQYSVTVPQLMEWNSLPDFNVKLGQQLIVSKR